MDYSNKYCNDIFEFSISFYYLFEWNLSIVSVALRIASSLKLLRRRHLDHVIICNSWLPCTAVLRLSFKGWSDQVFFSWCESSLRRESLKLRGCEILNLNFGCIFFSYADFVVKALAFICAKEKFTLAKFLQRKQIVF